MDAAIADLQLAEISDALYFIALMIGLVSITCIPIVWWMKVNNK
tara:strand:+ start:450 stop:581 length:132 start_codon:yes stop_codon:yes gene_type:complete